MSEYTLADFRESIERLYKTSLYGCGNHGCLINPTKGMATNATCKCTPASIARTLRRIAEAVETNKTGWQE